MKLNLGRDSEDRGGQYFEFQFSQDVDVWLRFWSWCLVKILKMKYDQDLCLSLWDELNPRVRCAFGNVCVITSQNWYWVTALAETLLRTRGQHRDSAGEHQKRFETWSLFDCQYFLEAIASLPRSEPTKKTNWQAYMERVCGVIQQFVV